MLDPYVEFITETLEAFPSLTAARLFDMVRIPVNLDRRSGVNLDIDSGQSDHVSERSDAGVGL